MERSGRSEKESSADIFVGGVFQNLDGDRRSDGRAQKKKSLHLVSQPVASLYTVFSKDNVRLTQCKKFADKYIEQDFVPLFIDIILSKPQVCRHIRTADETLCPLHQHYPYQSHKSPDTSSITISAPPTTDETPRSCALVRHRKVPLKLHSLASRPSASPHVPHLPLHATAPPLRDG
jgi:Arv1-like family